MQSHPKVPPSKAVTFLLHCVGKGDSQAGLCSLALLTQSVGTRYRIGPNTFNLPPAPGFTAQGFSPVSAQSSGYANCNLPASPHFSCWRWVLVPVTYPCLGEHSGTSPWGRDQYLQQWTKGKWNSWGWSCLRKKGGTWKKCALKEKRMERPIPIHWERKVKQSKQKRSPN